MGESIAGDDATARQGLPPDDAAPPRTLNGYDPVATAGPGEWFDPVAAQAKVDFFERLLTHSKGRWARQPFLLRPWQRDYIRTLFGWRRADGTRRYRRSFLFVPRKNGKTELAAGIAGACLFNDGETGAECYCTGYDLEQANFLFAAAAGHVRNAPALARRAKVLTTKKRILFPERGSFLRALPASDSGGHGANTHFVAYDEFHLYNTPRHVEVYESLHTSTLAREQPLELILTTAGWDRESLCYQEYETACAVRDGRIADSSYLPMIYEKPPGLDWTDPAAWGVANPNLGVTFAEDYLKRECERAKRNASYENTFRRLHLNEWTSQESRWIPMHRWAECWGTRGDLPADVPRWGGLDLSATRDLTAYVEVQRLGSSALGRAEGDQAGYRARGWYWVPEARLEEMRRHGLRVDQWVRDGYLCVVPGDAIELAPIERFVLGRAERGNLHGVGYDPWHAAAIQQALEGHGVTMVKVRQGAESLSSPCLELERALFAGRFDHSGDPVLAWCAENVEVHTDPNGNIRPVKPKHGGTRKIDAVSALVTALHVCLKTAPPRVSPYETPGTLAL
ncbi:MAG: terminase large subunit [Lacipirellulaceae bacterium]